MNNGEYTPIKLDVNVGAPAQRHALMAFLLTLEEELEEELEKVAVEPPNCPCSNKPVVPDIFLDFDGWRDSEKINCTNEKCGICKDEYRQYVEDS